jgi:hypothetical protein
MKWNHLCRLEETQKFMGGAAEHVLLLGPVCDFPPGTKERLSLQWVEECDSHAYDLALGTAERVLLEVLQNNSTAIRNKIAKAGRDGANHMRQQWREILDGALVPGQEEQWAELWRRTTRQITDWEVELITECSLKRGNK